MPAPPELLGFIIELSIDGAPALFLALSADGAVNRAGSGKARPVERDLFIQQTDRPLFREVCASFDPSWLAQSGLHALPSRVGPRHLLKLAFLRAGEPATVLAFEYGSDSGPPPAIQAFVQRALDVTQPWYDEQRRMAARFEAGTRRKPWWKLW